jgi:hypothetical protein
MLAALALLVAHQLASRTVHLVWGVDESEAVNASLPRGIINGRSAGGKNGGPGTGHGSAVNIYGNNGAFPSINAATGAVGNGGIPQRANVTLHTERLAADLAALIPSPAFRGVCLLDFEQLRADWNSTGEAQRAASIALAGNNDTALAQRQYEAAAKVLFLATIAALRAARPGCRVGWYGYPRNAPPSAFRPCSSSAATRQQESEPRKRGRGEAALAGECRSTRCPALRLSPPHNSYRQPSDGARRGKPPRTTDSTMAQSARGSAEITDDTVRGRRERGRRGRPSAGFA